MSQQEHLTDRTELLLRASRRGLWVVLGMVLLAGATVIAHEVRPGTILADWPSKAPWFIPVAGVFLVVLLNAPLRKHRWRAGAPEEQAILEDEFRQANLARAQRFALIVVLVAQVPLGLLFLDLTTEAAVMAMAVSSITLGMTALLAAFLYFDRE